MYTISNNNSDIISFSPSNLYIGIYIARYSGMELIAVKYSWNGKLLCLMLYLFNKYLSINPYSSIDVNSIFICSHMLSFTGKMNENMMLGNRSYIK